MIQLMTEAFVEQPGYTGSVKKSLYNKKTTNKKITFLMLWFVFISSGKYIQ